MPIFTQAIATIVALTYIGCARVLDALARTPLVLRSFLPEDTYGYKLSGYALDSLPELPAPLLVRCAFVSEQAGMLCIIGILSVILLLPIAIGLVSGPPTAQAQKGSGLSNPSSQVRTPPLEDTPTIQADRPGEGVDENSPLHDPPDVMGSMADHPTKEQIGMLDGPDDDTGTSYYVPSTDEGPGDPGVIRPSKSVLVARR